MARRYETLVLARTEITDDEQNKLRKEIETLAQQAGGTLDTFDRWGKYRLSYPVQKNEYGIYFLARYTVDNKNNSIFSALDTLLRIKCNDFIMRSVTVQLELNAPTAYEKPEALDTAGRSAEVHDLLKTDKIENLLSSVDNSDVAIEDEYDDDIASYDVEEDTESQDDEAAQA